MSKKDQTITGGLGLEDGYFEQAKDKVLKKLKDLDTISDALEAVAEEVRDDEFGESNIRVSDYEKKLILSGFVMGCVRTETHLKGKLDELKMVMHLMMMAKQLGKDGEGNPIMGGAVSLGELPDELQEIMKKIIREKGGEDEDDD